MISAEEAKSLSEKACPIKDQVWAEIKLAAAKGEYQVNVVNLSKLEQAYLERIGYKVRYWCDNDPRDGGCDSGYIINWA